MHALADWFFAHGFACVDPQDAGFDRPRIRTARDRAASLDDLVEARDGSATRFDRNYATALNLDFALADGRRRLGTRMWHPPTASTGVRNCRVDEDRGHQQRVRTRRLRQPATCRVQRATMSWSSPMLRVRRRYIAALTAAESSGTPDRRRFADRPVRRTDATQEPQGTRHGPDHRRPPAFARPAAGWPCPFICVRWALEETSRACDVRLGFPR